MKKLNEFLLKPYVYLFILIVGIALKFYHLDNKFFWEDEVSTILQTSGVHHEDVLYYPPVNKIKSISYYDSLLHLNTQPITIKSQIVGQATEMNLTPGHYLFLVFWNRIVGDDPIDNRLFSIFIFLITLPVLFIFLQELLGSALAGWIGASLYAVSPFIHYFSQESRYYILWALFFILLNYFFLIALKKQNQVWWILYMLAGIMSLYISILSVLFIAGHFIYVLVLRRDLWLTYSAYLLAMALAFLPWFVFVEAHMGDVQSSLDWHRQLPRFYGFWSLPLGILIAYTRSFSMILDGKDYSIFDKTALAHNWMVYVADMLILTLIIIATVHLFRKSKKEVTMLLALTVLPMGLFFLFSDIFRGTNASNFYRYQIVSITGIILIITNYLDSTIKEGKISSSVAHLCLVIAGIISIYSLSQSRCWMIRPDCPCYIADAQMLSAAEKPLVITDETFNKGNFVALMNECQSSAIDVVYADSTLNIPSLIRNKPYSEIFVVHASENLLTSLKRKFDDKLVPMKKELGRWDSQIWKIEYQDAVDTNYLAKNKFANGSNE